MPFTLTMPKLSPTMESGTLIKWHKKVGDYVNAGDLIFEIATDKATVEHEALDAGWLREILLQEGADANVNEPLAIFTEEENESIEGYTPEGNVKTKDTSQVEEKKSPAPSPKVESPALQAQSTPPVTKTTAQVIAPPLAKGAVASREKGRILASPLAKKLAREQGIDLEAVKGTGPSGRIMKRDLENAPKGRFMRDKVEPEIPAGTFEEIALTPIRKVIAQRLQEAKSTIPHFYVRQAVNVEGLIALREQLKNFDINVTFNDMMIKAVAITLREHPEINTGFNAAKNVLMQYKTIDISVAVSINGGLITPILPHADMKSVVEISSEIRELAKKAKEGKLQPHEFQGGSFTISNMGMYGITDFQAIINPPQAAILAVSGISDVARVKNGAIVPGKEMNITLSVDHRAIDGADAAKFMKSLQKHLENPAILLL